ncbi:MAG TPA: hypothetical protein VM715_19540, partial [Candidatus Acidoferrum sp.]|nr:hypothetical protein [Candidatus Acidoferrum sp.]
MSATQTATELGIPTLDVASFQKLLMAAWVIQCERERLRDLPDPFERDCPPDQFAIDILGEASERASAIEAVMAGVPGDHDVLAIDPSAKIPPARAERICSDEVSGALALAPAP